MICFSNSIQFSNAKTQELIDVLLVPVLVVRAIKRGKTFLKNVDFYLPVVHVPVRTPNRKYNSKKSASYRQLSLQWPNKFSLQGDSLFGVNKQGRP